MNRGRVFMNGKLYAVGVGPGDPELLTLKAVKTLKTADIFACPAKEGAPGLAYQIAQQACPFIASKEQMAVCFPMERGDLAEAHQEAADQIMQHLRSGKNVAFLTLGDPGLYSTFIYVAEIIRENGFEIEIINGIPSFCAASARLKIPVASGSEAVLITSGEYCNFDGTLVIMKAGGRLRSLKEKISAAGKSAYLVENCGLPNEKVYDDIRSMPDEAGYFSLLLVR